MNTPNNITSLKENEIFVFGSNIEGMHGKGAALTAVKLFGAKYGIGEGLCGQSYALPTVGNYLSKMSIQNITKHVEIFKEFAKTRPDLTFYVTKVGCGLAGHSESEIKPLFNDCPENCILPKGWGK